MAMQPNNPANATDANFTPGTEGITLLFQGDELRQTEPTRFRRPVRKPTHPSKMCGVIQSSSPLRLSIVEGLNLTFGADVAMCEHEVSDSLLMVAALGLNLGSPGASTASAF
jgi:hypothetical protein